MTNDPNTQANPAQEDGAALLEPPSGGRIHFGKLTIYAKRVRLESGAEGYQIPEITNFDGLPVQFAGKVPDEKSRTVHVVPVLTKTKEDGEEYTIHQNLLSGSREYKRVLYKSLQENVPKFAELVNTGAVAFVRVEEVPFADFYPSGVDEDKTSYISGQGERAGERVDRTAWKVAEHFATPAALKAASDEFFSQFDKDGESASSGGLGNAPGSYNVDGWAGITESIIKAFGESNDAVHIATEYVFIDDIKAMVAAGHSAPDIATAWGLPVPLVAQVVAK